MAGFPRRRIPAGLPCRGGRPTPRRSRHRPATPIRSLVLPASPRTREAGEASSIALARCREDGLRRPRSARVRLLSTSPRVTAVPACTARDVTLPTSPARSTRVLSRPVRRDYESAWAPSRQAGVAKKLMARAQAKIGCGRPQRGSSCLRVPRRAVDQRGQSARPQEEANARAGAGRPHRTHRKRKKADDA